MVSVIIPVYNGEKYISRCLESLLSSDTSELEVIAVNDGSHDSSSALLHEYEGRMPALRVIDKENGGAASARATGLHAARGEYIAFLDVDDYVEPQMYSLLEKKAADSGADIVFCDYVAEHTARSEKIKNTFSSGTTFPLDPQAALRCLHSRRAYFPFPWNKIYRADLMRRVEFPEGNFVGEDYNMQLQLLEMAEKIDYLELCGYHYVLTENSASRAGYSEATLRAYLHYKEDYASILEKHPDMKKDAANYIITEYMACIVAMGRNRTYNKEMIREIKKFLRAHLGAYLGSPDVPLMMKASALALCVSYRLLILAYRLIK